MRTLIIDDERHCRDGLAIMLSKHCPGLEVLAQCQDGTTALKAIKEHTPDLIFLDIEMPDMNGFEMLEQCSGNNFQIIFTTAYNEYAIRAIRHSALDYLLKPVNKNELLHAVARAKAFNASQVSVKITQLLELVNTKRPPERIALPTIDGLILIDIKDILYCESENNYTRFYLANGKNIFVSRTLRAVEALFEDNKDFFRIHHSFIINLNYVQKYLKGDGGEVVLCSGKSLSVSRTKKQEFLDTLARL